MNTITGAALIEHHLARQSHFDLRTIKTPSTCTYYSLEEELSSCVFGLRQAGSGIGWHARMNYQRQQSHESGLVNLSYATARQKLAEVNRKLWHGNHP